NIYAAGAVFYSTYDRLDRLKSLTGPATVNGISTQQVTTVSYDNAGIWLTNQSNLGKLVISQFDAIQRPVLTEIHDTLNANKLVYSKKLTYSADHHNVQEETGTSAGS